MKIGLSFSRCIRDIVDGVVDIDEVLVIISRTDFDPHDDEQWTSLWLGYGGGQTMGSPFSSPEWIGYTAEDEDRLRSVSIELWESGKLHQPRKFGTHPSRLPYIWLDTMLSNDQINTNPTAKLAWQHFQTVAGLTGVRLDQHKE